MRFLLIIIRNILPALPYFVSLKNTHKIIIKEYNTFVFNTIGIYMAEVLKAEKY